MSDLKNYEQSVKMLYGVETFSELITTTNTSLQNRVRDDIFRVFKPVTVEFGSDFTAQLEGLNGEKISPFGWALGLLGVELKSVTSETDPLFFEKAIAGLAKQGMWLAIKRDFGGLSETELQERLANKELSTHTFGVDSLEENIELFNKLQQIGIFVEAHEEEVLDNNIEDYNNLVSLYNALSSPKIVSKPEKSKQDYIYDMIQKGFVLVENNTDINGNTDFYTHLIDWLATCYCEKSPIGYKSAVVKLNEATLKSEGILDTEDLSIWGANAKSQDDDLKFRVFVKESEYSFEVVIKVPLKTSTSMFAFNDLVNNDAAAQFFGTTEYTCSLLESPKLMSMKSIYDVPTVYDSVNFVAVKDLLEFKKASWKLLDYIRAAKGTETNVFSQFSSLPLGEKIVVGVKPNGLKADIFDYTGQYFNSGLIIGGAGSGKSALIHSLIVQFLALKGAAGNGSVMLFDAKQELPGAWEGAFKALGIPFYGFDSRIIKEPSCAKYMSNKGVISEFTGALPRVICGLYFVSALQEVINSILGESGMEHLKDYNTRQNKVYDIAALPRIAVIMDEWNILYDTIIAPSKIARNNDPNFMNAMYNNLTGYPKKTRTQGLMWWYSGQDISKTYIGSNQLSSITYRIVGTMDKERYDYYNIVENETIKEYEKKKYTGSGQRPIMSQGSFYAGGAGRTEFVRSLFVSEEERITCLEELGIDFAGMRELDNLINCALKYNLFDKYCKNIMGVPNNLIFVALYDIGKITKEELLAANKRIFGSKTQFADSTVDYDKINQIQADRKKQLEDLKVKPVLTTEEQKEQQKIVRQINETEEYLTDNKEIDTLARQFLSKYDSVLLEFMQKPLDTVTDLKKIAQRTGKQLEFESEKEKKTRLFDGVFANKSIDYIKKMRSNLQAEGVELEKIPQLLNSFQTNYMTTLSKIKDDLEGVIYIGSGEESTESIVDVSDSGYSADTDSRAVVEDRADTSVVGSGAGRTSPNNRSEERASSRDVIASQIDTGTLTYNVNKVDDMGNVKAAKQLTQQVIKDIKMQFGGINNIESISVTASGCMVINNYVYIPQFSEKLINSLGSAIANDVCKGKIHKIVNLGEVINALKSNLFELSIESMNIAYSALFQNALGVAKGYDKLFKSCINLQTISLPDNELTRANPKGTIRGGGAGGKLAKLFGFGNKDKSLPNPSATHSNELLDRMFESRPVRILTGALGWTLGCKAVLFAATMFGPWGLLFGALTAVGTYKSYKNDSGGNRGNNSNNGGNRGNNSNNGGNRGNNNNNNNGWGAGQNNNYNDDNGYNRNNGNRNNGNRSNGNRNTGNKNNGSRNNGNNQYGNGRR